MSNYLIVGGTRGIGLALTEQLLEQGHSVTLWARTTAEVAGAMGILGIYSVVGASLSLIDRDIHSYPLYRHVLPFVFYVLYSFLLRQAFLDIMKAREENARRRIAEFFYVGISLLAYMILLIFSY